MLDLLILDVLLCSIIIIHSLFLWNIFQREVQVILMMTLTDKRQRKKLMMKTMYSLILESFFHQVLSKVLDLTFRNHHLILMMKRVLTLKMVSILPLDLLYLLGAVRNCLNQLKKREESVFGQWSKIILGRILTKFVFQFILMSPSLLYRNVLKIWNTHTFWIEHMNGVKRYDSA